MATPNEQFIKSLIPGQSVSISDSAGVTTIQCKDENDALNVANEIQAKRSPKINSVRVRGSKVFVTVNISRMSADPKSDNAAFDVHATDPMRLKKEITKDLGIKDSPNDISNPTPKPDPISGIQSAKDKYMAKLNK